MFYIIGNGQSYEDWSIETLIEGEISPKETVDQFWKVHNTWNKAYIAYLTGEASYGNGNLSVPPAPVRPLGMKSKLYEALSEVKAWREIANTIHSKRGEMIREWRAANPEPKLEDFLTRAGFKIVSYEMIR
jgi:hypothetical protein